VAGEIVAEARREDRIRRTRRIGIIVPEGGFSAISLDQSLSGMRIQTEAPLVSGERIYVPYTGTCRVVWVRDLGGSSKEAGVELIG
jgi:hypothetical protein